MTSKKTPVALRRAVKWFADRMEKRLRKHDPKKGKDGWAGMSPIIMYAKLGEEMGELGAALFVDDKANQTIIQESIDIANIAMMIADNAERTCPSLRKTRKR